MAKILELMKHQLTNVTAIDKNGDSVLHLVVKNDKSSSKEILEVLSILIDEGVDHNIKNKNDETVLHLAMEIRAKDIVEFLLMIKRTRDTTNFERSVITCLLETERNKMLKLMEQSEISENEKEKYESESASFVEWILSKNVKMDSYGGMALSMAMKFNLQHILPILLSYTNKLDKGNELLHQFLRMRKDQRDGHQCKLRNIWYFEQSIANIVRDLLDRGISPEDFDRNGMTALHLAINLEERIDIIEMLIDQSINVNHKNCSGQTAFHAVIRKWIWLGEVNANYYWKIARTLVMKGADINEPDDNGDRPLSIAVEESDQRVVEFFVHYEANFNEITSDGETLMHSLVRRNRKKNSDVDKDIKIFNILVGNGCKVNAINKKGLTPLHLFAKTSPTAIFQKLIEHNADINGRDNQGWTPLHHAAQYHKPDMAELLLKHGANVNAANYKNHTPLHLAIVIDQINKHVCMTPIFEILLKFGADPNEEFLTLPINPVLERFNVKEEFLFMHWVKLKAAKLYCTDNSEYKKSIQAHKQFHRKCLDEIETLKSNFIDGHVSLYTFLHMDPSSRCAFINNVKLKNLIGEPAKLEKSFPVYLILILASYHEAVTRKSLLGLAKETWLEHTKIILPDLCLECIFSFFRNSELFNFVEQR